MSAKTTDTGTMGKVVMLILQPLIDSASLGKCKEFPIIKLYSVHCETDEIRIHKLMVVYAMCIALARELAVTKKNINNSTIQLHMDQQTPYGNYIIISVMSFNYHFVIDTGVDPYFNHCRPIGLKHAILCSLFASRAYAISGG